MTTLPSKNNKMQKPPKYKWCIERIKNYLEKHKDYLYDKSKEQYFNSKCIFPFISLVLLGLVFAFCLIFRSPIVVNIKESLFRLLAVTLGFLFAAVRSWIKDWRQNEKIERKEEEGKPRRKAPIDMFWTYLVNYPILLSSIYIMGSYFLEKKGYPLCVIWTILFLFAYFVDIVWEKIRYLLERI